MSLLENWSHKFSIFNTSMGLEKRNEAHFLHSEFLLDHRRCGGKGRAQTMEYSMFPLSVEKNIKES